MVDLFGRRRKKADAATAESDSALLDQWFERNEDENFIWVLLEDGPPIDELATRFSSVPQTFLDDRVSIAALAGDVLELDAESDVSALARQIDARGSSSARRAAAIALWVWATEEEIGPLSVPLSRSHLERTMAALAFRLAPVVDPSAWISDAERRDEAARTLLLWSGQRPAGETNEEARAMYSMRDSLQHSRALATALQDHQHRLEVTNRLNAARAQEAAARYSSE